MFNKFVSVLVRSTRIFIYTMARNVKQSHHYSFYYFKALFEQIIDQYGVVILL